MYKYSVPVYGAIILNERCDKVLLVQAFFSKTDSWGFPRGKVNKDESEVDCAVREVWEEVGYDLKRHICEDWFVEKSKGKRRVKLFVVCGVNEKTAVFRTHTRKEIAKIEWHSIQRILATERGKQHSQQQRKKENGNVKTNYSLVLPFVKELHQQQRFLDAKREAAAAQNKKTKNIMKAHVNKPLPPSTPRREDRASPSAGIHFVSSSSPDSPSYGVAYTDDNKSGGVAVTRNLSWMPPMSALVNMDMNHEVADGNENQTRTNIMDILLNASTPKKSTIRTTQSTPTYNKRKQQKAQMADFDRFPSDPLLFSPLFESDKGHTIQPSSPASSAKRILDLDQQNYKQHATSSERKRSNHAKSRNIATIRSSTTSSPPMRTSRSYSEESFKSFAFDLDEILGTQF